MNFFIKYYGKFWQMIQDKLLGKIIPIFQLYLYAFQIINIALQRKVSNNYFCIFCVFDSDCRDKYCNVSGIG
jgi:hypothetical protein